MLNHFTHCVAILQAGDSGDVIEHPANLTDIVMSATFISCLLFCTLHLIILHFVYTTCILHIVFDHFTHCVTIGGDVIEHPANLTYIVMLASYHVCYFSHCVCNFTHCV